MQYILVSVPVFADYANLFNISVLILILILVNLLDQITIWFALQNCIYKMVLKNTLEFFSTRI